MCDPVTLGLTAVAAEGAAGAAGAAGVGWGTIGTIGTLATVAGTAMTAGGQLVAGSMAAKTANFNAQLLDQQAQIRLQKGEFDAAQAVNRYERVAGQQRANIGVTGINPQSFGDVLADSAMESALETSAIRWSAKNEAYDLGMRAEGQRYSAKAATIGSYFSAAGTVLGGAGKVIGNMPGSPQGNIGYRQYSTTMNQNFGA